MNWSLLINLCCIGISSFVISANAADANNTEKVQYKAQYSNNQVSLKPAHKATPNSDDFTYEDNAKPVVLGNDYKLKGGYTAVPAPKKRVKAAFSEYGIVSDLGVEKSKVYQYKQKNGITVFSDQVPEHENYQTLLYECFACRPDSTVDWYKIPLYTSQYSAYVNYASRLHRVEPALIRAVIHAESAFKEHAVSKAGAKGLMQLMPGTARDMGVYNAFDAQQNITGGSRYLALMLARFGDDIELASAAYNAGPTTVTEYNGVPPFPETQAYVKRVQILYQRYKHAYGS